MPTSKSPATGKSAKAPKKAAAKTAPAGHPKEQSAASTGEPAKITPKQALANTLALLKAKKDKTRQAPNYPVGEPVHPGAQGPHGIAAAQPEHAPTERLNEALHGHAYATERGDESKREQS